jgi:GST-like protein
VPSGPSNDSISLAWGALSVVAGQGIAFSTPFAIFYCPSSGGAPRHDPNQEEPMIELYGMGSPNVVKIYIALDELNLPYTVHPVDVFSGKQFDPAFLKLNPMAKVPVITDSEGPGGKPITLFESGAILLYLAEKTGQLLPRDTAAKYEAIEWMMVQMTTLGPMFGQHVHFVRFAPTGND